MIYWENIKSLKLKKNKNRKFIDNVCSFDIETTNYITEDVKQGFMYIWMFAIDENVYYGRTWGDFKKFIEEINKKAGKQRVIVYVHNLSFEFQFLRNVFEFENVFARKKREVLTCSIKNMNIDFKCSYALSNLSLEKLADVYKLKNKKMSGYLDYTKIRTSKTELTEEELKYCENDCLVVNEYIGIMLKKFGAFNKMPLTSTGIVRKDFKEYIKNNYRDDTKYSIKNWKEYVSKMSNRYNVFVDLCQTFAGGYVHANSYYRNKIVKNVNYYDFTSSYPSVMLTEKFPCDDFYDLDEKLEEIDTENRCYILDLIFTNIECKTLSPSISRHKANNDELIHFDLDNGRVLNAEKMRIKCTEQDFEIIKANYNYEKVEAVKIMSAKKQYLPKVFADFIMLTYTKKKELKKYKDEKQAEYQIAKEQLNSLFGMCITNYIRDNVSFSNDWEEREITEDEISDILNKNRNECRTMLPYSWGVWIAAYARKNIFDIINGVGADYLYTDTDSVAFIGNHNEIIENYNKKIDEKLKKSIEYYKEQEKYEGLKGIGQMSECEHFSKMKVIGAKRYAYEQNGKMFVKVSGVGKDAVKEIKTIDNFRLGIEISKKNSGHKVKYYNDEQVELNINGEKIMEKYGICIENSIFTIQDEEHSNLYENKKYNNATLLSA